MCRSACHPCPLLPPVSMKSGLEGRNNIRTTADKLVYLSESQ